MHKILVVNMNYMGDALLTTPALSALREAHADAIIDTVVGDGAASCVLANNPDVNNIIVRGERNSWGRLVQLYRILRAGRYQEVVILPPLPAYGIAAYLARTPVRVGLAGRGMDSFLTHRQTSSSTHMADRLLDTIRVPTSVRSVRRGLKVAVSQQLMDRAGMLLSELGVDGKRPIILLNVGATRKQKCWLPERFAAVIRELADADCVLVGAGPEDVKFGDLVLGACDEDKRPRSLIDKTSVVELAGVLNRSDLLISADSGSMHLASAVGTPVVALFGSTDPDITGPYDGLSRVILHKLSCSPCNNHPTCGGRYDCMHEITPDEVVLSVRGLLRQAKHERSASLPLPFAPAAGNGARSSAETAHPVVRERAHTKASRILIVTKFRFIGDTLVAIPVFRRVRELWPNAHITLLTGKSACPLLMHNPYLNEVIEFDPIGSDKGSGPFSRLVSKLRGEKYDVCLALNRSFHSALIPWLSGVRVRAGFDSEFRGMLLNRRVDYDREKSEIECYFDVLKAAEPLADGSLDLELWVSEQERDGSLALINERVPASQRHGRLIGMQPGASIEGKRWPAERFAELAERILDESPQDSIILVGGPDEVATAEEMLKACTPQTLTRVWSFVGATNLRLSLGLLTHIDLLVGNDTAIMHAAVALGRPTVAMFGPTNPRKWGHYGKSDRVVAAPDGQMTSIETTEVLAAIHSLSIPAKPVSV